MRLPTLDTKLHHGGTESAEFLLPLRQKSLYRVQQLAQGLAGKCVVLLADSRRLVFSKGKVLRFSAPLPGQTEAATALGSSSESSRLTASSFTFKRLLAPQPDSADTPMVVMLKVINDPLPLPRSLSADISKDLQQVLLKDLAKNPTNRYAAVRQMQEALRYATTRGYSPLRLVPMKSFKPSKCRKPALAGVAREARPRLNMSGTALPWLLLR